MFKGSSNGGYDLRDEFTTDLTTGSVHGTDCEPGPGKRYAVDTDSKMYLLNGKLHMAPHSTPVAGDPGLWIDEAIARVAGVMLKGQLNLSNTATISYSGFDINKAGRIAGCAFQSNSDRFYPRDSDGAITWFFSITDATDYEYLIALKSAGAAYFIKDSGIWKFLGNWGTNATATLYVGISNQNATLTSDYLPRVPSERWLPIPLVSHGFDSVISPSDGNGHGIASGIGSGGSGVVMTGPTWSVDTAKAKNTPTEGAELWDADAAVFTAGTYAWVTRTNNTIANVANELVITYVDNAKGAYCNLNNSADLSSDLTIGRWYILSVDAKEAGGDCAIYTHDGVSATGGDIALTTSMVTYSLIFKAAHATACNISCNLMGAGEVVTLDNLSLKPLTLSTLFSSVSLSTQDVVASVETTITAGTQAGLVICLDSTSSPANFILAYHNGTNAILEKCVAGTYSTLISTAATYAADAEPRIVKDGTEVRLYYNNALIGAVQTVSDAGIISNKLHGLFSTYSGNRLDNFNIYARGTQNQYANIDRY